jgi:hypothetical protein
MPPWLLLLLVFFLATNQCLCLGIDVELFVSPLGDDSPANNGSTASSPFQTLRRAQAAWNASASLSTNLTINLDAGVYTGDANCFLPPFSAAINMSAFQLVGVVGQSRITCVTSNRSSAAVAFEVIDFVAVSVVGVAFVDSHVVCDAAALVCAACSIRGTDVTSISLVDIVFSNVSVYAPLAGDALAITPLFAAATNVTLVGSSFADNSVLVDRFVSGVYPNSTGFDAFILSTAPIGGGACKLAGVSIAIDSTLFRHNSLVVNDRYVQAIAAGGAVMVEATVLAAIEVRNCTFVNNRVATTWTVCSSSGSIAVRLTPQSSASVLHIASSTFANTTIAADGSTNTVLGGVVAGLLAQAQGREARVLSMTVIDSRVSGSSIAVQKSVSGTVSAAGEALGGLMMAQSINLTNCVLENNHVVAWSLTGGALKSRSVVLIGTNCTDNRFEATTGTGMLVDVMSNTTMVRITESLFARNTVGTPTSRHLPPPEGLICATAPTQCVNCVNVYASTFLDNELQHGRGGIVLATRCDVVLSNSLFVGNRASTGGVLMLTDSSADIVSCVFRRNSATGSDGGVLSATESTHQRYDIDDSVFDTNSAANLGGALYFTAARNYKLTNVSLVNNVAGDLEAPQLASAGAAMFVRAVPGDSVLWLMYSDVVNNSIVVRGAVKDFLSRNNTYRQSCVIATSFESDSSDLSYLFWRDKFFSSPALILLDDTISLGVLPSKRRDISQFVDVLVSESTFDIAHGIAPRSFGAVHCESVRVALNIADSTFSGGASGTTSRAVASRCGVWMNNTEFVGTGGFSMDQPFGPLQMGLTTFRDSLGAAVHVRLVDYNVQPNNVTLESVLINGTHTGGVMGALEIDGNLRVALRGVRISNTMSLTSVLAVPEVLALDVDGLEVSDNFCNMTAMSTMISLANVRQSLRLRNVAVLRNSANHGAGMSLQLLPDGKIECANVTIAHNIAAVSGGGLFYRDVTQQTFCNVTLLNNTAGCWGDEFGSVASGAIVVGADNTTDFATMRGVPVRVNLTLMDAFGAVSRCHGVRQRVGDGLIAASWQCANSSGTRDVDVCRLDEASTWCDFEVPLPEAHAGDTCNVSLHFTDEVSTFTHVAIQVRVTPCVPGFSLERIGCQPCQRGTFNLASFNHTCHACPARAVCVGATLTSESGLFVERDRSGSDVGLYSCLPGVCLGGTVVGSAANFSNACVANRTGLLCASCIDSDSVPIAPTGDGVACVHCEDGLRWWLVCIVLLAVFAGALYIHISANSRTSLFKLLFYYAQVAPVVLPANLKADVLLNTFNFRVSAATPAFGGVCYARFDEFQLILMRLMMPFAFVVALAVTYVAFWSVLRCWRWRRRRLAPVGNATAAALSLSDIDDDSADGVPLAIGVAKGGATAAAVDGDVGGFEGTLTRMFSKQRFVRTCIAVVLLTFSVVLKIALDIVDCVDIGPFSVLRSDARVSCDGQMYNTWHTVALYVLCPYCLLVLAFVPATLWLLRRRNGGVVPNNVAVGVLYECYRTGAVALVWETVVLWRRVLIGLVDVLLPNVTTGVGARFFALNVINLLALLGTVVARPFRTRVENVLDVFQQVFLCVLGNNLHALEQRGVVVAVQNGNELSISDQLLNGPLLALLIALPPIVIIGTSVVTFLYKAFMYLRRKRDTLK